MFSDPECTSYDSDPNLTMPKPPANRGNNKGAPRGRGGGGQQRGGFQRRPSKSPTKPGAANQQAARTPSPPATHTAEGFKILIPKTCKGVGPRVHHHRSFDTAPKTAR